jgi:hypothetical protein
MSTGVQTSLVSHPAERTKRRVDFTLEFAVDILSQADLLTESSRKTAARSTAVCYLRHRIRAIHLVCWIRFVVDRLFLCLFCSIFSRVGMTRL